MKLNAVGGNEELSIQKYSPQRELTVLTITPSGGPAINSAALLTASYSKHGKTSAGAKQEKTATDVEGRKTASEAKREKTTTNA